MTLPDNVLTPIGNLRGQLTAGGMIPGVPVIYGETSGDTISFNMGVSNTIIPYLKFNLDAAGYDVVNITLGNGNIWDHVYEYGRINTTTGENAAAVGTRSKNHVSVRPSTSYYVKSTNDIYIIEYDSNKEYLRYRSYYSNRSYTTSNDAYYIRFYSVIADYYNFSINYPNSLTDLIMTPSMNITIDLPETISNGYIEIDNGNAIASDGINTYDLGQFLLYEFNGNNVIFSNSGSIIKCTYIVNTQQLLQWVYDNVYNP